MSTFTPPVTIRFNKPWHKLFNPVRSMFHNNMTGIGRRIYTVQHYNPYGVSISRLIRRDWILKTPVSERCNDILITAGECSLVQNIKEALEAPGFEYNVKLMCGPEIKDALIRDVLAELLRKYGLNRLEFRCLKSRPLDHYVLINHCALFEGKHPPGQDYSTAVVVEQLTPMIEDQLRKEFFAHFTEGALKKTPDEIRRIPLSDENNKNKESFTKEKLLSNLASV